MAKSEQEQNNIDEFTGNSSNRGFIYHKGASE